jgi:hypothetical protein
LKATDGRDIEEAKVHVETGALDVEDEASTGAIGDSLTFGAEADEAVEIGGYVNFERQTLDRALRNHTFENISTKASETKVQEMEESRAFDGFG